MPGAEAVLITTPDGGPQSPAGAARASVNRAPLYDRRPPALAGATHLRGSMSAPRGSTDGVVPGAPRPNRGCRWASWVLGTPIDKRLGDPGWSSNSPARRITFFAPRPGSEPQFPPWWRLRFLARRCSACREAMLAMGRNPLRRALGGPA